MAGINPSAVREVGKTKKKGGLLSRLKKKTGKSIESFNKELERRSREKKELKAISREAEFKARKKETVKIARKKGRAKAVPRVERISKRLTTIATVATKTARAFESKERAGIFSTPESVFGQKLRKKKVTKKRRLKRRKSKRKKSRRK